MGDGGLGKRQPIRCVFAHGGGEILVFLREVVRVCAEEVTRSIQKPPPEKVVIGIERIEKKDVRDFVAQASTVQDERRGAVSSAESGHADPVDLPVGNDLFALHGRQDILHEATEASGVFHLPSERIARPIGTLGKNQQCIDLLCRHGLNHAVTLQLLQVIAHVAMEMDDQVAPPLEFAESLGHEYNDAAVGVVGKPGVECSVTPSQTVGPLRMGKRRRG